MDGNPVAKNASRLLETNKHSRRLPLRLSICRRRLQTQTLAPTEAWEEEGRQDWSIDPASTSPHPLSLRLSDAVCCDLARRQRDFDHRKREISRLRLLHPH